MQQQQITNLCIRARRFAANGIKGEVTCLLHYRKQVNAVLLLKEVKPLYKKKRPVLI